MATAPKPLWGMSGSRTEDLARDALADPRSERAERARRLLSRLDEGDDGAEGLALYWAVAQGLSLYVGTATANPAAEVFQHLARERPARTRMVVSARRAAATGHGA